MGTDIKRHLVFEAFGGGTNSTALTIEWVRRGYPLDLILFADTGAERPETYCHIEKMSHWLAQRGYPEITVVSKVYRDGSTDTLEGQCLKEMVLPSIAYGFKACSLRYKVAPQDKFINNWDKGVEAFKRGEKIIKLIGYDYDEEHRVEIARQKDKSRKYRDVFPLYDWKWTRKDCVTAIDLAGIKRPGKSSCFFCPSMRKWEIREMAHKYPQLMERAIAIEDNAQPNLKTVKGLGRDWSWKKFIRQGEMFPEIFPEARDVEICCDCYDG